MIFSLGLAIYRTIIYVDYKDLYITVKQTITVLLVMYIEYVQDLTERWEFCR